MRSIHKGQSCQLDQVAHPFSKSPIPSTMRDSSTTHKIRKITFAQAFISSQNPRVAFHLLWQLLVNKRERSSQPEEVELAVAAAKPGYIFASNPRASRSLCFKLFLRTRTWEIVVSARLTMPTRQGWVRSYPAVSQQAHSVGKILPFLFLT
jgi:hypothetical protein